MSASILIAAQSGRALAEAARRAGLRPYVADLFGDADTLATAAGYRPLPGRLGAGPEPEAVLAALGGLAAEAGDPIGLVLGSGFEGAPGLTARLAARHRLLGAAPDCVAALKDPLRFARLCERLSVPHPAVTIEALETPAAWLLKRAGGSGGSHIRAATRGRAPPGAYFQERVPGRAHALNVLADGRGIAVLALTEQWSAPAPARPFRYAGALARARDEAGPVPPRVADAIADAMERIVAAIGLRGLASADVLVEGEAWWLLEVNPRPGATLDVLDRRGTPLLAAHIAAALGPLPTIGAAPVDAAGAEIWYGARTIGPVPPIPWPEAVRDRPRAGTALARGAPVCTILATGRDAAAVRTTLRARTAVLAALFDKRAGGSL